MKLIIISILVAALCGCEGDTEKIDINFCSEKIEFSACMILVLPQARSAEVMKFCESRALNRSMSPISKIPESCTYENLGVRK